MFTDNQRYRLAMFTALCLLQVVACADVVAVPFGGRGFLFSSAPTMAFVWPAEHPKATLVYVPGGEGHLGLTPERKGLGGFYAATLKPLSDASQTSGALNVVVFDSPVILPAGADYAYSRQGSEHLQRIESVVHFFKDRYGLPVWIMGHSNGAVSITEFYKMLQKSGAESLLAGAIYSSARNGSDFNDSTRIPVLFLAHERDGCAKATPSVSRAVFERLRAHDPQRVEYVLIKGGEAQAQHPCISGFHMFYGAGDEVYKAIDQFVLASLSSDAAH